MDAPLPSPTPPAPWSAVAGRLGRLPGARYLAAVGLVLASIGIRLLVTPSLEASYSYTCYYPGVILAAYWLGGRPALMAAGLSTFFEYNFMGPTPFSLPTDSEALIRLGFFAVSSLMLIHVLSTIRDRLNTLTSQHAQVEALAMGQAELFRDHAQRTTDHLQLISAILQLRARDEGDPMVSRVLTNAASRTLILSRTHRELAGGSDRRIPFESFARKLVEASAARGGVPSDRVAISVGARDVPLEQATSLGLVMLEYLNALKVQRTAVGLSVTLDDYGQERSLTLAVTEGVGPTPRDIPLFEVIAEQLGGRLEIKRGAAGGGVSIAFPTAAQPTELRPAGTASLH